jgi:hypothetical protein
MNGTDKQVALVEDYLHRLDRAAYALPPESRAELVEEIRLHVTEAQASSTGPVDETWTRNLLERLGTPDEIVAAFRAEGADAPGATTQRTRRAGLGPLETVVLSLLMASFLGELLASFHISAEGQGTDWLGLGRGLALLAIGAAWFSQRWTMAAKWTLTVVGLAFLVIWAVLVDFPPIDIDDGRGSRHDPPWSHWQGAFYVVAAVFLVMLVLLRLDLRRAPLGRFQVRELTALLLIGLGAYVGPLPAAVALVVAWRSPGLVRVGPRIRLGRWVAAGLLVPILLAGLTIPLGLAQRVNADGLLDDGLAWGVLLGCSAFLVGWLVFRFGRTPAEETS